MDRKLLFFDIDGTLWDKNNHIPESTIEAIQRARQNGHLAFINTGRTRAFVESDALLSIGFDGIISGCATMIEYLEKVVFYHRIENTFLEKVILLVRSHGFRPILEGRHFLYMDEEEFKDEPYGAKLKTELGERLHSIKEDWGAWEVSKLSCATEPDEHAECMEELKDDFEFMVHSPEVVEMSPKGFDKGVGIRKVCELLGADMKDSIAFGDSANDLSMLKAAGFSVCMGNGQSIAKEAADLVTDDMKKDGIYKACRRLGLF